jgi:hypothetical protein
MRAGLLQQDSLRAQADPLYPSDAPGANASSVVAGMSLVYSGIYSNTLILYADMRKYVPTFVGVFCIHV